jgi:hypothetical protein
VHLRRAFCDWILSDPGLIDHSSNLGFRPT